MARRSLCDGSTTARPLPFVSVTGDFLPRDVPADGFDRVAGRFSCIVFSSSTQRRSVVILAVTRCKSISPWLTARSPERRGSPRSNCMTALQRIKYSERRCQFAFGFTGVCFAPLIIFRICASGNGQLHCHSTFCRGRTCQPYRQPRHPAKAPNPEIRNRRRGPRSVEIAASLRRQSTIPSKPRMLVFSR